MKNCISVLKEDHLLYLVFSSECFYVLTMSGAHLILGLDIWFVFWILSFGCLFKSSYFLLFAFFSVKKLLFLFYPHSVRSCLLKASVQSVLNHGSHICLFVLESLLEYRRLVSSANDALQNAELLG